MIRLFLTALVAFVLAFPTVSYGSFLPSGIDYLTPSDCCCPVDEIEEVTSSDEVDRICCCAFEEAPKDLAPTPVALLAQDHAPSLLVALTYTTLPKLFKRPSSPLRLTGQARAPPLRSLFALQTSLLL